MDKNVQNFMFFSHLNNLNLHERFEAELLQCGIQQLGILLMPLYGTLNALLGHRRQPLAQCVHQGDGCGVVVATRLVEAAPVVAQLEGIEIEGGDTGLEKWEK